MIGDFPNLGEVCFNKDSIANIFAPWKNGISIDMSPATLVTGHLMPDYNLMRLEFGSYVQVFEDNTPSNTPWARSLGAIALEPTGNVQGDYNFMSLAMGAHLLHHQWTVLPLTYTAIARVHALGIQDGQPQFCGRVAPRSPHR